eukprot:1326009-Amorphochlora_amoeboformis.AAC.1
MSAEEVRYFDRRKEGVGSVLQALHGMSPEELIAIVVQQKEKMKRKDKNLTGHVTFPSKP